MPSNPPSWTAVRALFEQVLPLPPPERDAALAAAAGDAALVAEVRSLLAHAETGVAGALNAGTALEAVNGKDRAQPGSERRADFEDRTEQQLGAWRIASLLGRGGMGEVWLAERNDGAYHGQAAIKVLKRGMDSASVLARFAQERQALARLKHPNIAQLLDAGATADGLPYFVMEHVAGRPIDVVAREQPLAARLALFLQLTDAVSYAHRHLLVHRDLKPGNVLVDADGRVKLLDFGIAKALDPLEAGGDPELTGAGERPFTPHYASPEQVRGEPVSTATDLYSLGVLLYVLLTGQRPYGRHATTPAEAARSVLEEEPARPSSLASPQQVLEGDLDNILLKTLEKGVERRYASVDALAADLRAHLEGRPVSARAATPWYVTAKFLRRHRAAALAAALGLLGLASGLAATLLQGHVVLALGVSGLAAGLVLALVQARRAQLARDEAAGARDAARRQLDEVKRITGELVFRYGDTVTLMPGGVTAQVPLLRGVVTSLEPALAASPDDPELTSILMQTLGRLAEIEGNTFTAEPGRAESARATVEQALALAERAWPRSEEQWRTRGRRLGWRFANWVTRVLVVRAQLLRAQGRLDAAAAALQLAGARNAEARPYADSDEGRAYLLAGMANSHLLLAQVADHGNLPSRQRPDEALAEYATAERLLRELLAEHDLLEALDRQAAPGDASTEVYLRHQLGTIFGGRALVHMRQERLAEMLAEATAAVAVMRGNVEREPRNIAWRDGLMTEANTCSIALLRLGRVQEALEHTRLAWATADALAAEAGPASKWAGIRPLLSSQHGRALALAGHACEALEVIEPALAHWARQLDAERGQPGEAQARRRLGWHRLLRALALEGAGRADEAAADAAAAVSELEPLRADALFGREARLHQAEAHRLLARLRPAEATVHRAAARAALQEAAAIRPLGADHAAWLNELRLP